MPNMPKMRFYSGDHDGQLTHHDVALVENPNLPPPPEGLGLFGAPGRDQPRGDHDAGPRGLAQTARRICRRNGVKFNLRVNHGVTHSVYINDPNGYGVEFLYELPREMWEDDIDAGINYLEPLPTEGEEALKDDLENAPSFGRAAAE